MMLTFSAPPMEMFLVLLSLTASVSAINIGDSPDDIAKAFGDFDAEGITEIEVGVGGVSDLFGQAQVTVEMNASSVQGEAVADSANASDDPDDAGASYNNNTTQIGSELNQITGIGNVELDGASFGSITGIAEGSLQLQPLQFQKILKLTLLKACVASTT